jgi:hypothetical protein
VTVVSPASAADIGFRGFEIRAGAVEPDVFDSTIGLGLGIDLGEVYHNLRLYPSVFYISTGLDDRLFGDLDFDVIALGAEVRYFLDPELAGWYFGGGPYLLENNLSNNFAAVRASSSGVMGVAGFALGERFAVEGRYATGFKHFALYAVLRFG